MNKQKKKKDRLVFNLAFLLVAIICVSLCIFKGCSDWNNKGQDNYEYDDEYWRSVQREKTLKDNGMDKAADRERKERIDRLRNKNGSSYNGSEQQKRDLEMIDEYMKENPDF